MTAMFNDARVQINLDQGESTIKQGESLTINASVTLGGKSYDNSGVQWSVNDDMMQNGASYTFTPNATGDYRIKAGLEVNDTYTSQELMVHVQAPATTVSITGVSSMPAGSTTTLQANVSNPSGDTPGPAPRSRSGVQPAITCSSARIPLAAIPYVLPTMVSMQSLSST